MSTDARRSGFGPGFSKDVDSILGAADRALLYQDEVRVNLRIAGMVLRDESPMPDFAPEAYEPTADELLDEGENDA